MRLNPVIAPSQLIINSRGIRLNEHI